MNTEHAMRAALALVHRITEPEELERVRAPFQNYLSGCRFIDIVSFTPSGHEFKADVAHVVTKVDGKPASSVRKITRSDGRNSFAVPALTLEAPAELSLLDPNTADMTVGTFAPRLPEELGVLFAEKAEQHLLLSLLAAAEDGGKVIHAERAALREAVERATTDLAADCTAIVNWRDAYVLQSHQRGMSNPGIVGRAHLAPTRVLGEGIVLIVSHRPHEVGFVVRKVEPQLFVGNAGLAALRASVIGEYGFCAWNNAPVVKVDVR